MKKIISLLLVFVLMLSFAGCNNSQNNNQNNNQSKDEPLVIRGMITQLNDNGENTVILVEGKTEEDTAYGKARVTINKDTKIYEDDKEVTTQDLKMHMLVEVYYDGAIAESYPVQMGADKIVVVEKPAIVGTITNVSKNNNDKLNIMVEGEQVEGVISDKASITLDEKTEIYKNEELGDWKELSPEDLKLNMQAVVYYDGAVATSYPVQMGANKIVVIGENTEEIPAVKGVIAELNVKEKKFLVIGMETDSAIYDRAYVTVSDDTKIYRGEEKVTFDELMGGLTVEVYYKGAVNDSCPVQMGADKIIIIEELAIRGTITELSQNNDKINILVEGEIEEDTSYDKAFVTIDKNTKVYKNENKISTEDLAEGMKIEIYYSGAANMSYPVQIGANRINVLE